MIQRTGTQHIQRARVADHDFSNWLLLMRKQRGGLLTSFSYVQIQTDYQLLKYKSSITQYQVNLSSHMLLISESIRLLSLLFHTSISFMFHVSLHISTR